MDYKKGEDLSFTDSWKQKDVELAAGAAIIVGAGALAVKGDLHNSMKYGKQALNHAFKGADKYIGKKFSPGTRILYNTGKKTINKLSGKKTEELKAADDFFSRVNKANTEVTDETVIREAKKRYQQKMSEQEFEIQKALSLDPTATPPKMKKVDPVLIEEQVRQELREKVMKGTNGNLGNGNNKFNPKGFLPDRNKMKEEVAGGLIAGTAFAGGLTAFHAVDQAIRQNENHAKQQSFEAAGSFIKKDQRENRNMNKQADTRAIYEGIRNVVGNTPKGAGTAVGFTGVSLGTAGLLKRMRDDEEKQNEGQGRIIIELGEQPEEKSDMGHAAMGQFGAAPRFDKSAGVNRFLKNVGGRSSELRELESKQKLFDYQGAAADALKGQDVSKMSESQFGHLLEPAKAKEKLLEQQTNKLKHQDFLQAESIKDEVARDRLIFGGGVAGAGGLAGLAALQQRGGQGHV